MRFVDIPPLQGNVEVEVECDDVPDEGKGRSCGLIDKNGLVIIISHHPSLPHPFTKNLHYHHYFSIIYTLYLLLCFILDETSDLYFHIFFFFVGDGRSISYPLSAARISRTILNTRMGTASFRISKLLMPHNYRS